MKQTVYINADLTTMNPNQPKAEAFSVINGKFHLVGTRDDVLAGAGKNPDIIDLENQAVLPGFIETHNHMSFYALTRLMVDCTPFANTSIKDVLNRLKQRLAHQPNRELIKGWGFDDTLMTEGRHLTCQDLDAISPDIPIFISHASGHLAYANSAALKLGGITKETPQPAGGEIHKDEKGQPSGLLMEPGAMDLVADHFPRPDAQTFLESIPLAMADYNKAGVTSTHDAAVGFFGQGPGTIESYRTLEKKGELNVRVYLTTMFHYYDNLIEKGIRNGLGSDSLRFGSVKLFQDGSIQALTAALQEDYHSKPGYKGELIMPQEDLDQLIEKYHSLGMQIAIHANGDRAIESVLQAFEKANEKCPNTGLRHMIIHCQMATSDQLKRIKALGLIPSFFANHIHHWGDRHHAIFIGPDRAARLDPAGEAAQAGIPFTLHADTPVLPISPLETMHNAVNRKTRNGRILGEDQKISPMDALKAFTTTAALCSFEEDIKGDISPGKLADFIVVSESPLETDPEKIRDIEVRQTVVGGKTVFKK